VECTFQAPELCFATPEHKRRLGEAAARIFDKMLQEKQYTYNKQDDMDLQVLQDKEHYNFTCHEILKGIDEDLP